MATLMEASIQVINESSLSRMKQYADTRDFGIISAERGGAQKEENDRNTESLEDDLRKLGYGYVRVFGGYLENKGEPNEKQVKERSFIIGGPHGKPHDRMLSDLKALGEKYKQESILHKPFGSTIATIHYTNDSWDGKRKKGDTKIAGEYSPDRSHLERDPDTKTVVGRAFSQLVKGSHAGRKFAYSNDTESSLNLNEEVGFSYDEFILRVRPSFSNRSGTFTG